VAVALDNKISCPWVGVDLGSRNGSLGRASRCNRGPPLTLRRGCVLGEGFAERRLRSNCVLRWDLRNDGLVCIVVIIAPIALPVLSRGKGEVHAPVITAVAVVTATSVPSIARGRGPRRRCRAAFVPAVLRFRGRLPTRAMGPSS